jgi:hypothetical protein
VAAPLHGARAAWLGGPRAMEFVAPRGAPAREPGMPVLPDRAPVGGSALSCRVMGYRRDAGLCAGWGRTWPSLPARMTTQRPAMRVIARGGGGDVRRPRGRPTVPCLAQRRERRGRVDGVEHELAERAALRAVDGLAHQLAERALWRAACGRRGEHVFVRLGRGSDGSRTLRDDVRGVGHDPRSRAKPGGGILQANLHRALQPPISDSAFYAAFVAVCARRRRRARVSGSRARVSGVARARERRRARRRRRARVNAVARTRPREPAQRAPSEDQTSTLVRTFSTTASVNSVVLVWPPRSIVRTPVATVSSTPSYTAREARSAPANSRA